MPATKSLWELGVGPGWERALGCGTLDTTLKPQRVDSPGEVTASLLGPWVEASGSSCAVLGGGWPRRGETSGVACPLPAWGGLLPFCAGLRTSIYFIAGDRGGMEQEVAQPGQEGAAEASSSGDSRGRLSVAENPPPPALSQAAGCWTNGAPPTATLGSMMCHQPC